MRGLWLIVLAPVLVVQALWVILRATRLPEAQGPRTGRIGSGPPLRVLLVGDSSAAGVGVQDQANALGGQLARALAADFTVSWQVIARSGGTAASSRALLRNATPGPFDIAVTALGVNDSKNGVSESAWRTGYNGLINDLHLISPDARIYLSGVAPLGDFPLLPNPLRGILGARAKRFDHILRQIAANDRGCMHLAFKLPLQTDKMAPDGFHPGPEIYAYWAGMIADHIRKDIA